MKWSYHSLALSHRYLLNSNVTDLVVLYYRYISIIRYPLTIYVLSLPAHRAWLLCPAAQWLPSGHGADLGGALQLPAATQPAGAAPPWGTPHGRHAPHATWGPQPPWLWATTASVPARLWLPWSTVFRFPGAAPRHDGPAISLWSTYTHRWSTQHE